MTMLFPENGSPQQKSAESGYLIYQNLLNNQNFSLVTTLVSHITIPRLLT